MGVEYSEYIGHNISWINFFNKGIARIPKKEYVFKRYGIKAIRMKSQVFGCE